MKKQILTVLTLVLAAVLLASCAAAPSGEAGPLIPADNGFAYNRTNEAEQIPTVQEEPVIPVRDEDYGKIIENEFLKTETEPVSTFSADVDTASYAYFRKLVNQGYDLEGFLRYFGPSLRTEEMINYFTYDYRTPESGELFGVSPMISACPWNPDVALMRLGFKTEEKVKSEGNNFVFLIDVSGSMNSDDKLPLLKTAFEYLTDRLTEKDVVSVVTYSGKEEIVLTACEGTQKERILGAVRGLKASGATNGEAGLRKAYEIARANYITGGNNRIILASDGDLNVGISSEEELKSFVTEQREHGVYLSVLGFGTGNYKDAKMETLADNGNGVYYYIDGLYEAEKVFCTDLVSTLYTVAEDVKLQLTFDPEYVSEYRLVGYENRLLNAEDFEDDTKDAGEIGAGRCVTVCYELKLTEKAKQAAEETKDWMSLSVRYKEPGEKESKLNTYAIGKDAYTETPDADFRFAASVVELSMLLHGSEYLGEDRGLEGILEQTNGISLKEDDTDKRQFADLLRKLIAQSKA